MRTFIGRSSLLGVTLLGDEVATGFEKLKSELVVSLRYEKVLLVSKIVVMKRLKEKFVILQWKHSQLTFFNPL